MHISATIITLNEEKNIADCLASLDFVDDIVVLDSGSTDRTEEICRTDPKVCFHRHDWTGYGTQKNIAAGLANHDWILNIDADERVSKELATAILSADITRYRGFRMTRRNHFGRRWIKHCGWYPDFTLRFYDRRDCRFSDRPVHESVICSGPVGELPGDLEHYTYDGVEDYLKRMDRYSSLAAREIVAKGGRPGIGSLVVRPLATFVRMFLLKRGFLEGSTGLVLSTLYAVYTFCKYAKAREILKNEHQ
jgi:glycosyltransferase involved in cell wall biosynthesis